MSYSRWSHSVWYCYASVDDTLRVVDVGEWTKTQLLNDLDSVLQSIREKRFQRIGGGDRYTEPEIQELKSYMEDYIASEDV